MFAIPIAAPAVHSRHGEEREHQHLRDQSYD
jgi:hypothetical protein